MEMLARNYPRANGLTLRALNQAARELLLAQGSDWAFMISGAMANYATRRTKTHLLRLQRLFNQIDTRSIDEPWLSTIEGMDNIFPEIHYQSFS
jgi:1,4-alpha-glucan branching enzyme